jgi:hypothetical protein
VDNLHEDPDTVLYAFREQLAKYVFIGEKHFYAEVADKNETRILCPVYVYT